LPIPNPFVMREEAVYLHDQITELVRQALKGDGPISESYDIGIEELVAGIYGLNSMQMRCVYDALGKMQRLRIVRELLPQG